MDITTIKLMRKTKERLSNLKEYERETYDQVIRKVLHILNQIRKDPISANKYMNKIDGNIRRKRVYDRG